MESAFTSRLSLGLLASLGKPVSEFSVNARCEAALLLFHLADLHPQAFNLMLEEWSLFWQGFLLTRLHERSIISSEQKVRQRRHYNFKLLISTVGPRRK